MKHHVHFSNRTPISWRVDSDGLMRITLCALKEGVYEYGVEEVPQDPAFAGKDIIFEYIPVEGFAAESALASLEGKPVIIESHEWRDAQTTLTDGLTVGAIAGKPYIKDGGLYADAIIYDEGTQEAIKSGQLVEVSAAYDGDIAIMSGTFHDKPYDAVQEKFRFNHVLLLPRGKGRCGEEVRIINSIKGKKRMAEATLKVKIGNSMRTYRFTNENDQKEAEAMLEEQKAFNAEEVATAIAEKDALEAQIDELKAQLAEHDRHLAEAKAEIERHMSAEYQEALAEEAKEQMEDEDAIIVDTAAAELEDEVVNEEIEEECKEKIKNCIRKGSFAQRRRNAVAYVFKNQQREIPASWDQNAIDGAFEALVLSAKMRNAAREGYRRSATPRALNGKLSTVEKSRVGNSARERMLRPMQVKNSKEGK